MTVSSIRRWFDPRRCTGCFEKCFVDRCTRVLEKDRFARTKCNKFIVILSLRASLFRSLVVSVCSSSNLFCKIMIIIAQLEYSFVHSNPCILFIASSLLLTKCQRDATRRIFLCKLFILSMSKAIACTFLAAKEGIKDSTKLQLSRQ